MKTFFNNLFPLLLSACCLLPVVEGRGQPKLILPIGHTNGIYTASFVPDGKRVVTASEDKTAKLWNTRSGELLAELKHSERVNSVSFSPDGKKIVTASDDATAKIWNAQSGALIAELKGHTSSIYSAAFSSDSKKIVTASYDRTAKVWDAENGKLLIDLKGHSKSITNAGFSPDDKKVVTVSEDSSVKVWNPENGKLIADLKEPYGSFESAFFSFDSRKIVTVSDHTAKIWDVQSGNLLINVGSFFSRIKSACFFPDGKRIATSDDSCVIIWDAITGKRLSRRVVADTVSGTGYIGTVYTAVLSPDGKKIITSFYDNTAKVWDAESGVFLFSLKGSFKGMPVASFSPDSKKIVTTSRTNENAQIWDASDGSLLASLQGHTYEIYSACFSPGGEKILTSSGTTAKLLDVQNGKILAVLKGHTKELNTANFSPDGKKIITTSEDSTAKIWDAQNGKLLTNLEGDAEFIKGYFAPDNRKVITISSNTAKIWDTRNGTFLVKLKGPVWDISSACFSPDGQKIITQGDTTVKVWDAQTGQRLVELKNEASRTAFFSPDGKKIITAGSAYNYTDKIWDAQSGTLLTELEKIPDGVSEYSFFSPDGTEIMTAITNNTIVTRDVQSGKVLANRTMLSHTVNNSLFSPGGKKMIEAPGDNTVKVWDAVSGKLLYTFFTLDSSDYFIQLPSQYYFCTPDAAKLLHYVDKDLKVITFEQLDVKYNRPDLVLETIGCPDTDLIRSYKKAWQKRTTKLGFDTSLFTGGFHVPEADIQNRDSIQYDQIVNKLSLKIHVNDDSVILDRYNVWINEVPVFGVKGISLKNGNTKHFDTTVTVTLSNGNNRIEASVTNVSGLESYREPLDIKYTAPQPLKEKLYFIGIGMDHFNDSRYNLSWSVKDIRDLANNFKKKYGTKCIIDTLFDKEVNIEKLITLKQILLGTTENDKIIIAYSGHGLLSKDYDYFLSTYNVNFQKPEKDGLPYETLEDLLDGIPARKKLLLIDACHSGEVDKEELNKMVRTQAELDSTKKGVIVLVDTTNKRIGTKNSFELMQEVFVNVGRSTGATIISAAAGTQFALERGDLKNGVFTYSILELMKKNTTVAISELRHYVNLRVTELTKGMQVPTSRNENKVMDWEVW